MDNNRKKTIWEWPKHEFLKTEMDQGQKMIFDILCSLFDGLKNKRILEPGSGTARISFHLCSSGADITLCDLSENAVRGSQLRFKNHKISGIIKANLLYLPFKTDTFDLVWNSGVMEHFTERALILGLTEMARVSRRYVAVFVPFKDCLPYNLAKLISEAEGTWEWGLERPKRTLKDEFFKAGIDVIDEYEFGHETNIPLSYMRLLPDHIADELTRDYYNRGQFYPGVFLVTIGVKK